MLETPECVSLWYECMKPTILLTMFQLIPPQMQAALTEMRFPGMLCVALPVTVGLVFRWVGSLTARPMLGAEVRDGGGGGGQERRGRGEPGKTSGDDDKVVLSCSGNNVQQQI